MQEKPEIFEAYPTVYAVRERYVVIVPVNAETVMWVRVGSEEYFDDSNGILRSSRLTHKMELPMAVLDEAGSYTVVWRRVNERKPYYSDLAPEESYTSDFKPVRGDTVRMYQLVDAHNRVAGPIAAGSFFGDGLDALILNGDIPNHSGDIKYFSGIHSIASGITGGRVPVVFSRGNHDMRGNCAEYLADYTPTDNGVSYYPVRLGCVWMLVLDCAEDKRDDSSEYGGTIACHGFRMRESAFIESLAADAKTEYSAPGVTHRLVTVHNPFTETIEAPFDIEQDTYRHWADVLRETVKPELIICGHMHECYLTMPGDARDCKGQPCPVVVASKLSKDENYFVGAAITLSPDGINIKFTDNAHAVLEEYDLPAKP